jgi:homoserine kinase
MAVKTGFSPRAIQTLLAGYDLGQELEFEPISQGTVQTNYVLHAAGIKYIFRYYENRTEESVRFEVELLDFLGRQDFPCPAPVADRRGERVGRFQGKPFVVFTFLPGHPVEQPNASHRGQLVAQAARLQDLTRGYTSPWAAHRWNYSPALVWELACEAAQVDGSSNARAKLVWFEAQLAALNLPEVLPKGVCHGDFHFSNALFDGERLTGIIDFDDANLTYLSFDLAAMIDGWAWPHTAEALDLNTAAEIACVYQRHRPLGALEQRHLFDVHKLVILLDAVWYFNRGTAEDFYEKRKLACLDSLGREVYRVGVFGE